MTDNDPNIFKNTICDVCKKKVSTRLCDFVTDYEGVAFLETLMISGHKRFMILVICQCAINAQLSTTVYMIFAHITKKY